MCIVVHLARARAVNRSPNPLIQPKPDTKLMGLGRPLTGLGCYLVDLVRVYWVWVDNGSTQKTQNQLDNKAGLNGSTRNQN